jgi:hypothetical protein
MHIQDGFATADEIAFCIPAHATSQQLCLEQQALLREME